MAALLVPAPIALGAAAGFFPGRRGGGPASGSEDGTPPELQRAATEFGKRLQALGLTRARTPATGPRPTTAPSSPPPGGH
ncbi:hypothetical protein SUDANB121_03839 [Nocardiopsis dassonvillei]|uniref:hypothetical protein n=1 Tax=Nocardiopsis dassonvillei TaxID=2014 RepID=UPI003F57AE26